MSPIALLTDFGLTDEYVGVMKGVILSINPEVRIIDISHNIAPQHILQASLVLNAGHPFFPDQSIFVVVVDPGVGVQRDIIAAHIGNHYFLAPDNGLLPLLSNIDEYKQGVCVQNPGFFLKTVSRTFHGRDIFAPTAAYLSKSIKLSEFGAEIDRNKLKVIELPQITFKENALYGQIQYIDHFGNLMTNVEKQILDQFLQQPPKTDYNNLQFVIREKRIQGLSATYGSVAPGKLLATIGSRNFIEISVNCGNAHRIIKARLDDPIIIQKK